MTAPERPHTPPPFVERTLGALVADGRLREAVLGDLAEEFAERRAQHGPRPARRWYRGQAARSAPALLAATWWPAPGHRARRLGRILAAGVGGGVLLQSLHQAAQLLVALTLTSAGLTPAGWPLVAGSLAAGAGCGLLAGAAASYGVREAPLAGALALAVACGVLAVGGIAANGGVGPVWYWGGLQLVVFPAAACLGGLLRVASRGGRAAGGAAPAWAA